MMTLKGLQSQLIKLMRENKLTQSQLNEQFNFTSNQVYRWESEQNKISWEDFIKVGYHCEIDILNQLEKTIGCKGLKSGKDLAKFYLENCTRVQHFDEKKIKRLHMIAKNEVQATLYDILDIIHLGIEVLIPFISLIVDIEKVTILSENYLHWKSIIKEYTENPIAMIVLGLVIENEPMKIEQIIDFFPSHQSQIERLVNILIQVKQLRVENNLLFVEKNPYAVIQQNSEAQKAISTFLNKNILKRFEHNPILNNNLKYKNMTSYATFTCSETAHQEIDRLFFEFLKKAQRITVENTQERPLYRRMMLYNIYDTNSFIEFLKL